jgi:hypothetical protein
MSKLKLITFNLQNLHNAEFKQFFTRFFEDFDKTGLSTETDPDFKALFDNLKAKIPTLDKASQQIRANEETKKLAQLDRVRDYDMQALRDSIRPYKNAKTEAKQAAYSALKTVLDKYKEVSKDTYEEETSELNSLIATLKGDECKAHVKELSIKNFIDELETSNNQFNELFSHRSFQVLQKETFNIRTLRREIGEVYQSLCNYVLTLANIKQDEFYKKVLDVINNSRKYYADVLSRRKQ